MKTQRLARSSLSPELRFTSLKGATNIIPRVAIVNAISAGWLKKARHPPSRTIARPNWNVPATRLKISTLAGVKRLFIPVNLLRYRYNKYIQYIRNMPNIKNKETPKTRHRFIQGMAELLTPLGVPQTAARLYGYLLLCEEPVSLDRIVDDLEISKSTASVAAHLLEMYTLVRRSGQRGTRRVLFEPSD